VSERTIWAFASTGLRPWRSAAGVVALVLIAGQLAWRAVILSKGFWTQDDFLMLTHGGRPLTIDLLFQDYAGHMFPGGFLIAWLHTHLAPLDWGVAVVELVVLQMVASLLAWVVLCRLMPGSTWRLTVLTVYLFCPLALWPTQWWCVAIQFLPGSVFLLLATWAMLHRLQEGSRWSGPLAIVAIVMALLFQERAVLFPLVLGFVAIAYAEGRGVRRVAAAVLAHRLVWASLVVLLIGYLVLHGALAPVDRTSPGAATASASLVGNFVGRNAVPGFVGGPWGAQGTASFVVPADWAVGLSWVVLALLVTQTMQRSRSAAWGWLLLLAYTLLDVALLFGGRTIPDFGAVLGLVPRYAADIVPVLAIALGLVVRACEGRAAEPADPVSAGTPRGRWRRRVPVAVVLAGCYLVSAVISTSAVAPLNYNQDDRAYVDWLRADLRADARAVLFDGAPPQGVMVAWFGDDARVSNVVGTAPEDPVFDLPTHNLRMVDAAGRLRPVALEGAVSDVKTSDRDCVHHVERDRLTPVRLEDPAPDGKLVARISYFTATPGVLVVATPDARASLALRSGLNMADIVVQGPLDGLDLRLRPTVEAPSDVCVVDVVVGHPTPG
jgi:hypothetical protein